MLNFIIDCLRRNNSCSGVYLTDNLGTQLLIDFLLLLLLLVVVK